MSLEEEGESAPILLSRVSRVSMMPAPPSSSRRQTVEAATPPLAGVDWTTRARRTQWLGRAGLLVSMMLTEFRLAFATNRSLPDRVSSISFGCSSVFQRAMTSWVFVSMTATDSWAHSETYKRSR